MPRRFSVWFLAAALALPALAQAQQLQRNFPQTTLRGRIAVVQPPEITLNGQPARLAPGARIRGQDNMLILSASLAGQSPFVVNYTLDTLGLVKDVWMLRADEAKRRWPTNREEAAAMVFDPLTQTWTKR